MSVQDQEVINKLRALSATLEQSYVGRENEARALVLSLAIRQHILLVGPPGTAKTAMVMKLAELCQLRYFYYLVSRFTVPDEIVGPIDPVAFKAGKYVRMTNGKIVDAELAFIDEVFNASSEVLNALLSIMNERRYVDADGTLHTVPLVTLIGASNRFVDDPELQAFTDRFLIKLAVRPLATDQLREAIELNLSRHSQAPRPILNRQTLDLIHEHILSYAVEHRRQLADLIARHVGLVRAEVDAVISDRTATSPQHLPMLAAAIAIVSGASLPSAVRRAIMLTVPPVPDIVTRVKKVLYPSSLVEAREKLDDAKAALLGGEKGREKTKRLLAEATQKLQDVLAKPAVLSDFSEEVEELERELRALASALRTGEGT